MDTREEGKPALHAAGSVRDGLLARDSWAEHAASVQREKPSRRSGLKMSAHRRIGSYLTMSIAWSQPMG